MQAKRRQDAELLHYPHTRTDQALRPRFCLQRRGGELYFVDHSDEMLEWVANDSAGGFDNGGSDGIVTAESQCRYERVGPGEGVLIDAFDYEFDGDMYIASSVTVASPSLGVIRFHCVRKGGPGSLVLLWQDGFVSPRVRMTRLSSSEGLT